MYSLMISTLGIMWKDGFWMFTSQCNIAKMFYLTSQKKKLSMCMSFQKWWNEKTANMKIIEEFSEIFAFLSAENKDLQKKKQKDHIHILWNIYFFLRKIPVETWKLYEFNEKLIIFLSSFHPIKISPYQFCALILNLFFGSLMKFY